MEKNYNKLNPITNALFKYVKSKHIPWWGLGYIESQVPNGNEINNIITILSSCDPNTTSTFKYVINLIYNDPTFKTVRTVRQAAFEYLDNYIISGSYERKDIAKYLSYYAPRYYRPWWGCGYVILPKLKTNEETVLQKFRKLNSNYQKFAKNLNNISTLKKLSETTAKKSKLNKLAKNLDGFSFDIYNELPKVEQKIQLEIKRISEDLDGLSRLIDIIDNDMSFNHEVIKKQMESILKCFDSVIISASESLKNKVETKFNCDVSSENQTDSHSTKNDTSQDQSNTDNIEIKIHKNHKRKRVTIPASLQSTTDTQNKISNPKLRSESNSSKPPIRTEGSKPKYKFNFKKSTNNNITPRSSNTNSPTTRKPKIKTIIANEMTYVSDRDNIEKSSINYEEIDERKPQIKSYINQELTERLQKERKIYNNLNSQIKPWQSLEGNSRNINVERAIQIQKEAKNKEKEMEYSALDFEQSVTDNYFRVTFTDPDNQLDDTIVAIDPQSHVLKIDEKEFNLASDMEFDSLESYLEVERNNLYPISLLDIVTKFMYDTTMTIEDLKEVGLRI